MWRAVLLFGCLGMTGCGTFSDALCGPVSPGKDPVYYRGVRFDIAAVKEGGANILLAADIPFSAVADTVRIPYLARRERQAKRRLKEAESSQPAQPGRELE